jgi:hypothetical protein
MNLDKDKRIPFWTQRPESLERPESPSADASRAGSAAVTARRTAKRTVA